MFTPLNKEMRSALTLILSCIFIPTALLISLLSLVSRWVQNSAYYFDLTLLLIVLWMNDVLLKVGGKGGMH